MFSIVIRILLGTKGKILNLKLIFVSQNSFAYVPCGPNLDSSLPPHLKMAVHFTLLIKTKSSCTLQIAWYLDYLMEAKIWHIKQYFPQKTLTQTWVCSHKKFPFSRKSYESFWGIFGLIFNWWLNQMLIWYLKIIFGTWK